MLRTALARQARLFSTTTRLGKTPLEAGKEALKTVDRTVADAAVKGIETGESVAQSVKETVGYNSSKATGEMSGRASEMSGKASEVAGEAKGKAHEVAGEAKGKVEEVKSKI